MRIGKRVDQSCNLYIDQTLAMCLALHPFFRRYQRFHDGHLLHIALYVTSVSFQPRQTCQSGRILVPCPRLCPVLSSVLTSALAFKSTSVLPYFYTSTTAILSPTMSSNASASTSLRVLRSVPLSTTASVSASYCSSALACPAPSASANLSVCTTACSVSKPPYRRVFQKCCWLLPFLLWQSA